MKTLILLSLMSLTAYSKENKFEVDQNVKIEMTKLLKKGARMIKN